VEVAAVRVGNAFSFVRVVACESDYFHGSHMRLET
jgi:hypothetical protein